MNNVLKNKILLPFNLLYKISPKTALKLIYRLKTGENLNLKNPITYTEKIQWIKLYDRNKLMPECSDKFTVRKYVENHGCKEILNDLIWEGFNPEDIPFDILPQKFVIKVTHGSTFNIICKDKNNLNIDKSIRMLKKWLKDDFLLCYGEWFYGKVKPRIIVEKYIESENDDLIDYKIFCFNGKAKYIDVHAGRDASHTKDIFTKDWKRLENYKVDYPNSKKYIEKPNKLDDMLKYAEILSKDFLHARVDFYIAQEKIIFGEITFTSGAGFAKYDPVDFNIEMGSCLELDGVKL